MNSYTGDCDVKSGPCACGAWHEAGEVMNIELKREEPPSTTIESKDGNIIHLHRVHRYTAARMERLLTKTEGMMYELIPHQEVAGVSAVLQALERVQAEVYSQLEKI